MKLMNTLAISAGVAAALLAATGTLGAAGAAPTGARADTPPDPVFGPRPRFAFTPAELAAWKADPTRADELKRTLAEADRLVKDGLTVPTGEGQWIFYYACPDHDADLRPEGPDRHVCPVCGKVFTDERTRAAYRTRLYNKLERDLVALARAWALTGDVRYAAPAREAMLKLAADWPTLERHDRWGRRGLLAVVGGRRYCQLLDEATSLITLSEAYDLLAGAPELTAEDRAALERGLLGDPAREIMRFQAFTGQRNNHQTWFNAAYAAVGLATGDTNLLREAVYGAHGLLWQLDESVTSDGLWYEGALAYHFYALQAVMKTLEAAGRAGWTFRDNARLKSLWLGPLQLAYPNGECPVFHDSDPTSLAGRRAFYQWAADYFGDPVFATYAAPTSAPTAAMPGSTNLAGIGLAVLRRGSGDNAACAMMDYGLHGDHHGHPDKLGIVLYGLGRELMLDPGRISYSVPEYQTWCRTTVAHNTLVVDGRDQTADCGRLVFFRETPRFAAALAVSDGAYPGRRLSRFLLLADGILVDLLAVDGERPAAFDWVAHVRGTLACDAPLALRDKPLATANGYQHLRDLREGASPGAAVFDAKQGDGRTMRIWCLDTGETTLATGTGIGYTLKDTVPFLMRRRKAGQALFATVYDLSGDGSAVTNVSREPLLLEGRPAPEPAGVALRIGGAAGDRLIAVDLRDDPTGKPLLCGEAPVDRLLVVEGAPPR